MTWLLGRSLLRVTFKDHRGGIFPAKLVELSLLGPRGSRALLSVSPNTAIELTIEGRGVLSFTGDHHHTYRFRVKVFKNRQGFLELQFDDSSDDMLDLPRMATISVNRSSIGVLSQLEFIVGDCKEVLLLTGTNYRQEKNDKRQNFAYRRYAYTRMHDLAHEGHFDSRNKARKGKFNKEFVGEFPLEDSTVITHFDCQTGQMSQWVRGASSHEQIATDAKKVKERAPNAVDLVKKDMWAVGGGWCRINLENVGTKRPSFEIDDQGHAHPGLGAISITHIYEYIQKVGADRPGTLVEFGIYSHAYRNGPILFNTYERPEFDEGGARQNERDREDHDGQFKKDFEARNMDATQKSNFRNAFSSDAFIKLYGCFYDPDVLSHAKKAYKTSSTARKRRINKDIIDNHYKQSYAFSLSKAAGRPVFGGAPGVSADRLYGHDWFLWPYLHEYKQRWKYDMNKRRAKKAGIIPVELRPGKRVRKGKSSMRKALYYYKDTLKGNLSWDWYLEYDAASPLTP